MSRRLSPLFSAILLGTLAFPVAAHAADYTFRTVDAASSNIDVEVTWMNNSGLIAQQYQSPPGSAFPSGIHTALLNDGVWTNIDVPKAAFTGGSNPNAHGQVALTYALADGIWHVAIYDHGKYLYQPDIPGYQVGVQGLNDRGQLAAVAIDAGGVQHGLVGNSSAFTVFDYPDSQAAATIPMMVNNQGIAVGQYQLKDQTAHAFLYDGSRFKNIDVPGAVFTAASGINESNEIVGIYKAVAAQLQGSHGFLLRDGQYTTVDFPGATGTVLYQINDSGDLAGTYQDASGNNHGFVATRTSGG